MARGARPRERGRSEDGDGLGGRDEVEMGWVGSRRRRGGEDVGAGVEMEEDRKLGRSGMKQGDTKLVQRMFNEVWMKLGRVLGKGSVKCAMEVSSAW